MKRVFQILLVFCFLLAMGFAQAEPVLGQSTKAQITIFDKLSQPVTSLVDGNTISIKIQIPDPLTTETNVDFLLSGIDSPISTCHIPAGIRSCETATFSTLGWYWNLDGTQQLQRTISARLNGQQAQVNVTVYPRPVVMVHGFNADFHSWDNYLGPQGYLASLGLHGYAVGDGQVEGVLNTGSISDPTARTNTIAQNAAILGIYIDNVQKATGAEKVDLLVHSMGGMISRYYLDRVMTHDNVAQLIILGTPMAGTACSSLPAALGVLLPATLEIQPSYMVNVFNQQIVHRKGVPFYALAGTKLEDTVESPCTPVPSDMVVAEESVKAIPMPVQEIPLLHIELNTSLQVFEEFVTPLIKTPPGKFETAVDPPPGSTPPTSQQFTKVYTGHLDPGATNTVTVSIDPNVTVANFALFDTSHSLDVRVQGASGNEITLDPVKNGLRKVDDPSTMVYLGYGFKQPKPGKWVVTLLTTVNTPPEGADYAISANFEGGATLSAKIGLTVPRMNEAVPVSATLTEDGASIPLETAQVKLRKPDGSAETLDMKINGNAATLEITPKASGIYGIEVDVTSQASDGTPVDRAAFLTFEVEPTNTQITTLRLVVGAGIVLLLLIVFLVLRIRKKRVS